LIYQSTTMKKSVILLFVFCLHFIIAKSQWVTIPDADFVSWLTQSYPSCMSGNQINVNCPQILIEDSVDVSNQYISDLTGIEYFVELKYLKCSNNLLLSLPLLPNTLAHLDCQENQFVSLSQLPSNLKYLNCSYNGLTSLPLLPDSLNTVYCSNNLLTNLPVLPNQLDTLICNFNNLTSLPSLTNTSIRYLWCQYNLLDSLPAFPNTLKYLYCNSNFITNIPTLTTNLIILSCGFNSLTDLPSLPSSLKALGCDNNQITVIPTLPDSLKSLSCGYNQLTSLPTMPSTIKQILCNNNLINSLPAFPNFMITFEVANNNIACLFNLPELTVSGLASADISNNPLTCVPNQTSYSIGLPLCIENDTLNNPNNCFSTANISGFVYVDQDSNCTYNSGDLVSNNIMINLYDSLNNLIAQNYSVNGLYGFMVNQIGSYEVKIEIDNMPYALTCLQADSQIVNLNSILTGISNINFSVTCDTLPDFSIQSVSTTGIVFPGQLHTLNTNVISDLSWYNLNCGISNNSGVVTIQVLGPIHFISPAADAMMPQVNGNTYTYNIGNFDSLNSHSFGLIFQTDSTAQTSNSICVNVEISTSPQDADTSNNVYNFCYNVVNSYDPNMKEVYPVDVLPGYDDWFTYTIHFQNTGNAPAFNIRLRDTIDTNLDINSFEILGYSHPANVTLSGNILSVKFNNIMLPDSTTDYEGSMAYFQYRLKPLPNLSNGTQIENTAYIYFDYNAPIVTNTTQNNFDITVGKLEPIAANSEYILYPNPSNGIFNFKDTKNLKHVEVYNLLGEQILAQGNQKQINLSGFAKGIYYARINGEVLVKLVKD